MKFKQKAAGTVLVLGDAESQETNILTQSGLELELLSEDSAVRFRFGENCLFVDPTPGAISNPVERRKLFKKLRMLRLPPLRSVVLAVDCETFLSPDGAHATKAKARDYRTILDELARDLDVSFPIYVLFTNAEKINYFSGFVENLNAGETAEMLGVSLSLAGAGDDEEEQARRLNDAFQTSYYWLADRRTACLRRKQNASRLANIYEFPREFAKLRPLVVQFLTDVCGSGPVLRGFYFCGVGIFVQDLFPGLVLADSMSACAQGSGKANLTRRLLVACVAATALLMAAWWSVSYVNNAALVQGAIDAGRALSTTGLTSGRRLASSDSLRALSDVRARLQMVNGYERRGPPLIYRALLYQGTVIRPALRNTYYAMFRRLLLQPTQQTLLEIARNPGTYPYVYDALKAYLITTVNPDKNWKDLAMVLVEYWKKELPAGSEREAIAIKNFMFYAEELREANPYVGHDSSYDHEAVEAARTFLNGFPLEDGIYQAMLDSSADYAGANQVAAWFTKAAYDTFQEQLKDDANLRAEDWVLGRSASPAFDFARIRAELRARYEEDFAKAWRGKEVP